jgi:hypothetical protein
MSGMLIAEFADHRRLVTAARRARQAGYRLIDAFTPIPVEGILELLEPRPTRIRVKMFIGGVVMAALAFGLEYFSAVVNYPYNSGGRPLDSWLTFMLPPFATGIFVAAVVGFIAFLRETGLPSLYNPLFAVEGFERASQDRSLLAFERPNNEAERKEALDFLQLAGASAIQEINA